VNQLYLEQPLSMTTKDESGKNLVLPKNAKREGNTSDGISDRVHRLGILSLGWHAHEKTMPAKLLERLKTGDALTISNIIPILGQLSALKSSVTSTYICHPSVKYVTKLKHEGSFCGYRNIQMLISFILGSASESEDPAFSDRIPSILTLQDLIEEAWDNGFNTEGRIETGGIRGTRKHIGTPEAQALFKSLGNPCQVHRFESSPGVNAFSSLLDYVEEHFRTSSDTTTVMGTKIRRTTMPPMYLQRPRHSLTIVGIELHTNGQRNLLVLDPGYRPSPRMIRAAQAAENGSDFDKRISLTPYRKGRWQLGGYKQFETLTLRT
jgi:hypothetical protein